MYITEETTVFGMPVPCGTLVKEKSLKEPKYRRGKNIPCLIVWPGERQSSLIILRQVEKYLIDQGHDRKFLISEAPAFEIVHKGRIMNCYVCDAEKGCTVAMTFKHQDCMAELWTDPRMVDSLLDSSFVSQVSTLKPSWKSQAGMAIIALIMGFLFGVIV